MQGFAIELLRLTLWLALLTAIFMPLERLFALRPQRILRRQVAVDLGYYFINSLLTAAALALPLAVLATLLHRILPAGLLNLTTGLPFWWRVAAAYLVGELGFYWGHRWSHEIPLLWRFHAVHHSPEEIDYLSSTRGHPIDVAFTRLCGFVPLYALGLAQSHGPQLDLVPAMVVVISSAWAFFVHANLRWRFGWLEFLVSTPAFHRWHHTSDEHRDHNYASLLPIYDRIFGTLHLPKTWPASYGIDAEMPPQLGAQLLEPFRRRAG